MRSDPASNSNKTDIAEVEVMVECVRYKAKDVKQLKDATFELVGGGKLDASKLQANKVVKWPITSIFHMNENNRTAAAVGVINV